jgi:hypothetical protein
MVLEDTISMFIYRDIIRLMRIKCINILVITDAYAFISKLPVKLPDIMIAIVAAIGDSTPGMGVHMKVGSPPMGTVHTIIRIVPSIPGKGLRFSELISFSNQVIKQEYQQKAQEEPTNSFKNDLQNFKEDAHKHQLNLIKKIAAHESQAAKLQQINTMKVHHCMTTFIEKSCLPT